MKKILNTIFRAETRNRQPETPPVRPSEVPNLFRLLEMGDNREISGSIPGEGYSLLFVRKGSIETLFKGTYRHHIAAGEFLVFHNPALQSVRAKNGSELILHTPSEEVARLLEVCVEKFHRPASDALPIPQMLGAWLDELSTELAAECGTICSAEKERAFSDCLLASTTSSGLLGEVYIAYLFRKSSWIPNRPPQGDAAEVPDRMNQETHLISL